MSAVIKVVFGVLAAVVSVVTGSPVATMHVWDAADDMKAATRKRR